MHTKPSKKAQTAAFRSKTGSVQNESDDFVPPRAQKFNRFLGEQIRIEINKQKVERDEMNPDPTASKNLLFYDFNGGARTNFGLGGNMRLATRGEFRRTGMAGAKLIDTNKIEAEEIEEHQSKRRPITSHFRGGDRLPTRQSKTRDRRNRIHIGTRKKTAKKQQQGLKKKTQHMSDSVSPKNERVYAVNNNHRPARQNVHTAIPNKKHAIFDEFNNENEEPTANGNFKFRERMQRKKDIIIEEEEDNEDDFEKFSQHV